MQQQNMYANAGYIQQQHTLSQQQQPQVQPQQAQYAPNMPNVWMPNVTTVNPNAYAAPYVAMQQVPITYQQPQNQAYYYPQLTVQGAYGQPQPQHNLQPGLEQLFANVCVSNQSQNQISQYAMGQPPGPVPSTVESKDQAPKDQARDAKAAENFMLTSCTCFYCYELFNQTRRALYVVCRANGCVSPKPICSACFERYPRCPICRGDDVECFPLPNFDDSEAVFRSVKVAQDEAGTGATREAAAPEDEPGTTETRVAAPVPVPVPVPTPAGPTTPPGSPGPSRVAPPPDSPAGRSTWSKRSVRSAPNSPAAPPARAVSRVVLETVIEERVAPDRIVCPQGERCPRKDICRYAHDIPPTTCIFWVRGNCTRGKSCKFNHHLPRGLYRARDVLCPWHPDCRDGKACIFKHYDERATCRFWVQDRCHHGPSCVYKHAVPPGTHLPWVPRGDEVITRSEGGYLGTLKRCLRALQAAAIQPLQARIERLAAVDPHDLAALREGATEIMQVIRARILQVAVDGPTHEAYVARLQGRQPTILLRRLQEHVEGRTHWRSALNSMHRCFTPPSQGEDEVVQTHKLLLALLRTVKSIEECLKDLDELRPLYRHALCRVPRCASGTCPGVHSFDEIFEPLSKVQQQQQRARAQAQRAVAQAIPLSPKKPLPIRNASSTPALRTAAPARPSARVLYTFPQQGQSLQETSVAVTAGEVVTVLREVDGWTCVKVRGAKGYVPTKFLEPL